MFKNNAEEEMGEQIKISILVPTYQREHLLERNLDCCAKSLSGVESQFEVIVGDNGAQDEVHRMVDEFALRTGIATLYLGAPVTANMQENHLRLLKMARGTYAQFIHDDDFLLPGAGSELLASVAAAAGSSALIKHRVRLVNLEGKESRVEGSRKWCQLNAEEAVGLLIRHSSFVRFPAVLIPRKAFLDLGGFDVGQGNLFDLAAWLLMAAKHGMILSPRMTVAFTRHEGSETNTMFEEAYVQRLEGLLGAYAGQAGLSDKAARKSVGMFLWRYLLAGALRAQRAGDGGVLVKRLALWEILRGKGYECPWRWRILKWYIQMWAKWIQESGGKTL